jgi:TolB-like protein/class 3 adenylate cyclase/cytochrome c-type biogenesis protein CcmH/NrfG
VSGARVERKLAAILAADVAGYSRLMEQDEAGTLARLKALRRELIDPRIADHKGRIVKTTGDGILAEFPSVVEAVACGVAVQRAMPKCDAGTPTEQRIEFRIGIHQGDIIVEDGDIFGDGVNVAARLEGLAEPGGICVSARVQEDAAGKLDLAFEDAGEQQLRNITRPVRAYRVVLGRRPPPAVAAVLPPLAPRLSIVVLPFANLSNDPEQDYFVDGVTESLTTDLSRISGSFVIARNTAFTYKGKPFDVREIGRELGVRYVLEGSVQRGGNRMRVNVQLIDAESGTHLWAERFDKPLADLFDMQDEVVARLANTLNTQLINAAAGRAERTSNPDSMDLTFQGLAWRSKGHNPADLVQARRFFERALALDPGNLDALLGAAHTDALFGLSYMADDRAGTLAAVEATLIKALALAPNNAWAHYLMGQLCVGTNRGAQGIAELERALALNPNYAVAHAEIGLAKVVNGHAEETEAHILEALRLSPRDTYSHHWLGFRALAKQHLGAQEEAVAWYRRSIEINPNRLLSHVFLAAALVELGRLDEARTTARAGLAIDPNFTLRRLRAGAQSDNPVYLKRREQLIEAMRKAGIPEE